MQQIMFARCKRCGQYRMDAVYRR